MAAGIDSTSLRRSRFAQRRRHGRDQEPRFEAPRETSSMEITIEAGLRQRCASDADLREALWPEHDRANRAWIAAVQPLLERHGTALSQALTRAYETTWPSHPVPVDLSVTAGPNGAYTTGPPTHVTISSSEPGLRGLAALEVLFHESSHSPVSDLFQRVRQAASERKVSVPPQLWHGVLFYTTGELTTRELKAHGIAYTPFAGQDAYTNLCGAGCRERSRNTGRRASMERSLRTRYRAVASFK